MDDVRGLISKVNPGRRATKLGNDGIDPWVSLPRRFTPSLVRRLELEGVATRVREGSIVDDDRYGVFVMLDEVVFPGADPHQVQRILDDWQASLE